MQPLFKIIVLLFLVLAVLLGLGVYVFDLNMLEIFDFIWHKISTLYLTSNSIWLLPLISIVLMIIEVLGLGWEKSSLKRLVVNPSKSAINDWFFYILAWSRINFFLGIFLSFGLVYFLPIQIKKYLGFELIPSINNIYLQYLVYFLILDLTNWGIHYGKHHLRFYWELHKIHHSATEFNILTDRRSHPIGSIISNFLASLPIAILGAPVYYFILFAIFKRGLSQIHHTSYYTDWGWLGYIVISPAQHAVHHSSHLEHFNKNFGSVLNIWDRLFGTFYKPSAKRPVLGLLNESFNQSNPINDFWRALVNSWKALRT